MSARHLLVGISGNRSLPHVGHEVNSFGDLCIQEILTETNLYFVNSDPTFEYSRPILPNVIYVGGLTMKKAETLDEDWERIVQNSEKDGVVLFSLGSVANTSGMPWEYKVGLLNIEIQIHTSLLTSSLRDTVD